jgi:lipopolysaccharide export LptBFGC system permease protein LptF
MTTRTKIIISIVVLIVTFAAGRWSASQVSIKTTQMVTQNDQKAEVKDTHTKTTITETKQPTGVDTTITVIDQVQDDKTAEKDNSISNTQTTITPTSKSKLNISILGAEDFSKGFTQPTYGLSVNKEVLGPVTVGAFGLMNGTVGISVGLDF